LPSSPSTTTSFSFFFYCYVHHRYLHSFPTRRSSDLVSSSPGPTVLARSATPDLHSSIFYLCPKTASLSADSSVQYPHGTQLRYLDRKSTRLNSSHSQISYAVFCLKKKKKKKNKKINHTTTQYTLHKKFLQEIHILFILNSNTIIQYIQKLRVTNNINNHYRKNKYT